MSGSMNGTREQIKISCPDRHDFHCVAHCLNIAISDSCKLSPLLRQLIDIFHQIVNFIRTITKQRDLFTHLHESCESDVKPNAPKMSLRSVSYSVDCACWSNDVCPHQLWNSSWNTLRVDYTGLDRNWSQKYGSRLDITTFQGGISFSATRLLQVF